MICFGNQQRFDDELIDDEQISTGEERDESLLGSVIINNEEDDDLTPCCDRSILIGKVFKAPEKRFSIFDLVEEASKYHNLL